MMKLELTVAWSAQDVAFVGLNEVKSLPQVSVKVSLYRGAIFRIEYARFFTYLANCLDRLEWT